MSFHAVATEEIPPNRFMTTTQADGDPTEIGVEVTQGGHEPDFYTTSQFAQGDDVYIALDNDDILWEMEAGGSIDAGQVVANGADGKAVVRDDSNDLHSVGIALEGAENGDIFNMWRHMRLNGPLATDIISSAGGSSYTDSDAVSAMSGASISPGSVSIGSVLNMPAVSSAPGSPSAGDIYVDDGTNTSSGSTGFRYYDGSAWVDL